MDEKLPHVTLIGDSIRHGYKGVVGRELDGVAVVWSPNDNCRWCQFTLDHLDEWMISRKPDVVHLNNGLHDMVLLEPENKQRCTVEEYAERLGKIFDRITKETKAKLIFATTTPVLQERQPKSAYKRIVRYDADPPRYNVAAVEVAKKYQLPINDLYTVVMNAGKERMLKEDGVHFTAEGCELLGKAVAKAIREQL